MDKKAFSFWKPINKTRSSKPLFNFNLKLKPANIKKPLIKSPPKIKSLFNFSLKPKPIQKKNKNLTWKQIHKRFPKVSPYADSDGDGVINKRDCRPFDRRRQDEGTYNIEGQCTTCGGYHPCDCEMNKEETFREDFRDPEDRRQAIMDGVPWEDMVDEEPVEKEKLSQNKRWRRGKTGEEIDTQEEYERD